MLNALSMGLATGDRAGHARVIGSFERQGFACVARIEWAGGHVLGWGDPRQQHVEDCVVRAPHGTACCLGPLWYAGKFGTAALAALIEDSHAGRQIDEAVLRGNFVLFLHTARHCVVFNDGLGFARLYTSPDGRFHSTSWLATCAYAGKVALNEPAAIEYVLLGASHSSETVASGITTLPPATGLDLTSSVRYDRPRVWEGAAAAAAATLDDAVARMTAHFATVFEETSAAFPGQVRTALSGGFDSRLILAGLLSRGNRPGLFVYGNAASGDVPIARAVAGSVGLALDVIDKGALDAQVPPPDLERLVSSALFFDGLPNDGIDDAGADQQTRLRQSSAGRLELNGGGGEIFRNYFHLPDWRYSAMDIVRAFYRGFDRGVLRQAGALAAYERRMAESIARAIGVPGNDFALPLDRHRLELAYPLFRCHHWMAVNNSVALRYGYYATPLIDPVSTAMAWQLPLRWKNAGLLEARLIKAMHPGIAGQMSEYGFRFSDGPHARVRWQAWMDRSRPVWLRPLIGSAGRRLRRRMVAPGWLAHCRTLLPGEWCVDHLLDLARLTDSRALARALAVEVVWRKLLPSGSVPGSA